MYRNVNLLCLCNESCSTTGLICLCLSMTLHWSGPRSDGYASSKDLVDTQKMSYIFKCIKCNNAFFNKLSSFYNIYTNIVKNPIDITRS